MLRRAPRSPVMIRAAATFACQENFCVCSSLPAIPSSKVGFAAAYFDTGVFSLARFLLAIACGILVILWLNFSNDAWARLRPPDAYCSVLAHPCPNLPKAPAADRRCTQLPCFHPSASAVPFLSSSRLHPHSPESSETRRLLSTLTHLGSPLSLFPPPNHPPSSYLLLPPPLLSRAQDAETQVDVGKAESVVRLFGSPKRVLAIAFSALFAGAAGLGCLCATSGCAAGSLTGSARTRPQQCPLQCTGEARCP